MSSSSPQHLRIAVIGLGSMGFGMATSLKRAGHAVTGCDVSAEAVARFVGEGGHFIDVLSWWLGAEPVRVSANTAGKDVDNLVATFDFADGSVASLSYLTGGDPRVPKEALEISASTGFAAFDNFAGFEVWHAGQRTAKKARLDKGQRPMLDAFIAAVASGTAMPIGLESLLATTRATLAVQQSAAAGMPVDLTIGAAEQGVARAATGLR